MSKKDSNRWLAKALELEHDANSCEDLKTATSLLRQSDIALCAAADHERTEYWREKFIDAFRH